MNSESIDQISDRDDKGTARGAATSVTTDLTKKYPVDQPIKFLDAADLRALFRAAYEWLAHNYEQVNRLNVFPVPDGDTGTNMLLTIKSAWANIGDRPEDTVGAVAEAAAEGAHHGSRGNSGVILGQILRGFSQSLREKVTLTAHDLAEALVHANEAAYNAVPSPVEGTILTVSREATAAAQSTATSTFDLRTVFGQIVAAADEAVRHTPELLPVLKNAGVVDSGGKGLYFLFEGMHRALTGQPVHSPGDSDALTVVDRRYPRRERKGHRRLPPVRWGFDVQYLIERPAKPIEAIAAEVAAMGECPLVEGDEHLVKVHVHVFDPGVPLSYGASIGFITDIVVENMDDMANAGPGAVDQLLTETVASASDQLDGHAVGLVAVVPGEGFAEIFVNLGAHGIVSGGQSMNPSVAEIAAAIRRQMTDRVVVLPNNRNILLAAEQAAKVIVDEEAHRQVLVVPSATMPQGVAALTVFDPLTADLNQLVEQMTAQMATVHSGEVTQAVRTAEVDGIRVNQGDVIGLCDGELVSRGDSVAEVAKELLHKMHPDEAALITIYYGDFVAQAAAEDFAQIVREEYSELDVELAYGGQPHYHYILSVE